MCPSCLSEGDLASIHAPWNSRLTEFKSCGWVRMASCSRLCSLGRKLERDVGF